MSERIEAAAIEYGSLILSVPKPGRHYNVFRAMFDAVMTCLVQPEQQGFLTSTGRFVGREEARTGGSAANC